MKDEISLSVENGKWGTVQKAMESDRGVIVSGMSGERRKLEDSFV